MKRFKSIKLPGIEAFKGILPDMTGFLMRWAGLKTYRQRIALKSRKLFFPDDTAVSMKLQMILLLTGLAILPILVMGIITFVKVQDTVRMAQESMLSAHAQGIRHSLESTLAGVEDTMKGIASQSNILILMEDVNQDGVVNDMALLNSTSFSLKNAVKGSDKLYESAFIADKSGKILVEGTLSGTSAVGESILNSDYYQRIASKEKFAVGSPIRSKITGRLVIPMAKSIETLAGRNGTLVVLFDHQRFMAFLETAEIGDSGEVHVLDSAGKAIHHPDPDKIMMQLDSDLYASQIRREGEALTKGFSEYKDPSGTRLAAWEPLGNSGWTIVVSLSRGEFDQGILQIRDFMLFIMLATAISASLIAVRYAESLTKPIKDLSVLLNRVAQGCLEVGSIHRPNREVADLNDNFNRMLENLKALIAGISDASDSVSSASQTLGALSAQTFASAENMMESVEEIASGAQVQSAGAADSVLRIHTMASSIQEVHAQADGILAAARSTEQAASQGMDLLKILSNKSEESQSASLLIQNAVAELNVEIQRISGIVESISKIAGTTNLLALNASIEAARAGDAGRGFTVVAQEVRKLAEQTAHEAADIRCILQDIQKKSHSMEAAVIRNGAVTEAQNQAVSSAGSAFGRITQEINITAEKVTLIADAIETLDRRKEEMIQTVSAIAAVTTQTADAAMTARASTQEQFSSVEHLRNQAEDLHILSAALMDSIQVFKSDSRNPELNLVFSDINHTA